MKTIELTQDKQAVVDDIDYHNLNQFNWMAVKDHRVWYAVRSAKCVDGKVRLIKMHRQILGMQRPTNFDHINGNGLDNRRENLREASVSQNGGNRRRNLHSSSGIKGVSWHCRDLKWTAHIGFQKKRIHLGYFKSKQDAANAYAEAAKRLFGDFHRIA